MPCTSEGWPDNTAVEQRQEIDKLTRITCNLSKAMRKLVDDLYGTDVPIGLCLLQDAGVPEAERKEVLRWIKAHAKVDRERQEREEKQKRIAITRDEASKHLLSQFSREDLEEAGIIIPPRSQTTKAVKKTVVKTAMKKPARTSKKKVTAKK